MRDREAAVQAIKDAARLIQSLTSTSVTRANILVSPVTSYRSSVSVRLR